MTHRGRCRAHEALWHQRHCASAEGRRIYGQGSIRAFPGRTNRPCGNPEAVPNELQPAAATCDSQGMITRCAKWRSLWPEQLRLLPIDLRRELGQFGPDSGESINIAFCLDLDVMPSLSIPKSGRSLVRSITRAWYSFMHVAFGVFVAHIAVNSHACRCWLFLSLQHHHRPQQHKFA